MLKIKPNDIAFTLETIAHLNYNPAIKPYVRHILIAALVLRNTTEEQMNAAIEHGMVANPNFYALEGR